MRTPEHESLRVRESASMKFVWAWGAREALMWRGGVGGVVAAMMTRRRAGDPLALNVAFGRFEAQIRIGDSALDVRTARTSQSRHRTGRGPLTDVVAAAGSRSEPLPLPPPPARRARTFQTGPQERAASSEQEPRSRGTRAHKPPPAHHPPPSTITRHHPYPPTEIRRE